MAKEIVRKRVTLHPLKEDGTTDTSINLYPKTFIDGIVDSDGKQIEVQEKLTAGENITIEDNTISAIVETVDAYTKEESDNKFATIDYVDNNKGTKLYKYTGYISKNSSYPSDATSYSFVSNIYDEDLIGTKQLTSELAHKLNDIKSSDLLSKKIDLNSFGNGSTIISFTTFDLNISGYLKTCIYKTELKDDGTFENTAVINQYLYASGSYLFYANIEEL